MEKRRNVTSRTMWGCLMMACCFMLFCGCGRKEPSLIMEDGGTVISQPGEGRNQEESDPGDSQDMSPEQIYVQVSGAVVKPGVYQLPADSRVFMAIELAGGFSQEADEDSLNQVEVLSDGQQVYVYAQGERDAENIAQEAARETDGRINLNTASAQELMTLPGIGQSKADSIISYRESNGSFQAVEDLMKIEGIKEGVFSKIKDRVKI